MEGTMSDWPLPLRLILVALAIALSAWGFATGSVLVGVIGVVATAVTFAKGFMPHPPPPGRNR
jgi:hypothetical protein